MIRTLLRSSNDPTTRRTADSMTSSLSLPLAVAAACLLPWTSAEASQASSALASPLVSALMAPAGPAAPVATGAGARRADTPFEFLRRPGTALGITSAETHDLEVTAITTQFGDDDPVVQQAKMRLRSRCDVALSEEAQASPLSADSIRRRFIALEGTIQIVDPDSINPEDETWTGVELKLNSPLTDLSVAFVPASNDVDGYGRFFDGRALRESVLPRLGAPADWSLFLPPAGEDGVRSANLGDSWDIDLAALEPLLAPGGFLGWRLIEPEDDDDKPLQEANPQVMRAFDSGVGGNLQIGFDGKLTGTAVARLQLLGTEPEVGFIGEVLIEFDMTMRTKRDDFVADRRFENVGELTVETLGADLEVALKGTASIVWGRDLGRPVRAVAIAQETVQMTVRVLPPEGAAVSQTVAMKGALRNDISFKDLPVVPLAYPPTVIER